VAHTAPEFKKSATPWSFLRYLTETAAEKSDGKQKFFPSVPALDFFVTFFVENPKETFWDDTEYVPVPKNKKV
jgi:hypothetical protein